MGGMALGAGASLIGGAITAGKARKAAKNAEDAANVARGEMAAIKNSRVPIINPYSGSSNLSALAKDLSNMLTNPYASLGVATQAADRHGTTYHVPRLFRAAVQIMQHDCLWLVGASA